MAIPKFFERRVGERKSLTGLMPGKLFLTRNSSAISKYEIKSGEIDCKAVDISEQGLGIVSSLQLTPGTQITLRTHDQELSLRVSWAKPDFGKRDLYRYGLSVENSDVNLEQIFIDTGCIR